MKNDPNGTTRRSFLKAAAGTAVATSLHAQETRVTESVSPNDRIRVASIGFGQQGRTNTRNALSIPGIELAGVADLYEGRRKRARELFGASTMVTPDYLELIHRNDVDAVIVSTSDHWHERICIEAMEAGKDVYCEKPMVQKLDEGARMIEAEKRTGRILLVGSQRTSSPVAAKARDLIAGGAIGELIQVEAWYRRSSSNGAWQYVIPPDASPKTVDWERFLGHAPARPYDADRFFRWRSYWDYGTGIPGDLFVHLLTGLHFITRSLGPTRIAADGGLRFWKDGREVPDLLMGLYGYPATSSHPAFNVLLQVNFADIEEDSGFRFTGSEGVMTVGRTITITKRPRLYDIEPSISTFPQEMQDQLLGKYVQEHPEIYREPQVEQVETIAIPAEPGLLPAHLQTFFEGVRTRKPVVQDSVFGFRAAGPALATNVAFLENRVVDWDPRAMKIG